MMNFETCPICSQNRYLSFEQLKPMVLSGCGYEMQCDICFPNRSFKLPDCEGIREMARHQRFKRYVDPSCPYCKDEGKKVGTGKDAGEIIDCSCFSYRLVREAKKAYLKNIGKQKNV